MHGPIAVVVALAATVSTGAAQEVQCAKDPRWLRVTVVDVKHSVSRERLVKPCDITGVEEEDDGSRITLISNASSDRVTTETLTVRESVGDLCAVLNCGDAVRGR